MAEVPISSGISQIQGHVPKREDFLLLGCGFPSHLISPGPPFVVRVIDQHQGFRPPQPASTGAWVFLYPLQ